MGSKLFCAFVLLVFIFGFVSANEKYSYEKAEELTPLIEWRDYGPSAFEESLEENKPIFLLLTAPSWCYWCQVYESEEYLFHPEVVEVINEKFIPVYVDADKRQDLTRQYLEGGWPSTTVLTPGKERLFGFSGVRPVENMISNLNNAARHVQGNKYSLDSGNSYEAKESYVPNENELNNLINGYSSSILAMHDYSYGGFGSGQKFPQGRTLDFALEVYEVTGDERFLEVVQRTLENQYTEIDELETNYNLYDPVEGGFHRYGTQRDWTPPHYEKMLYDNARLLKAYYHLLVIDLENSLAKEVAFGTHDYIKNYWYDSENGGFYGNTDVHGEDAYYGKNPRPSEKPRVEETKYTDWNSEAILTYLTLYGTSRNPEFGEMARDSLNFYEKEMVSEYGTYHYYLNGKKEVRGNLLDNSYLLLAFVEGYEVFGDGKYLDAARKIADYSIDNLYDWNSGGFFERNSPDENLYAPGEEVVFSKPIEENGIMTYALAKLSEVTKELKYLDPALKTFGYHLERTGSLDNGYYYVKSAKYILDNDLIRTHNENLEVIEEYEKERKEDFWGNNYLTGFVVSSDGIESFNSPIVLLFIIAILVGFISFASPCTLPILPAYLAFSFKDSGRNLKAMSIAFFLGLAIVFTILGMSATFFGSFFKSNLTLFGQIAGALLVLFGVLILMGWSFSGLEIEKEKPKGYWGSFLFGSAMGVSWTPCVGPFLVAILILASTTGSTFSGGILLFGYALGLGLPLIILSSYLDRVDKEGKLWKFLKGKYLNLGKFSIHSNSLISGVLFVLLGILIFTGQLINLNSFLSTSSLQGFIFGVEEWFLGFVS